MAVLRKIADTLDKSVLFVCTLMLIAMTCLAGAQVFFRYVVGGGVSWTEEACRFLFCWSALLGSCCCLYRKRHVAMTLLVRILPVRIRKSIVILSQILSCILFYVMIKYGITLVGLTSFQTSPALGLNMGYVYSIVPISGIIMMFFALENLLCDIFTPADKIEIGGGD